MDIWAWTFSKRQELCDAGQERLADIMGDLPHWTCEGQHDRAEALYNEGLALARENDEKWVEVFLRHWHMQSQVLGLRNANKLPEVIDLLNFSHQEDTRDCPQRVCTVQDLANCYSIKDGPAYFEERVAVARETLAEINASWPCYSCISSEMISAYLDVEDYDTALTTVNHAISEMAKVEETAGELAITKARALLGLGRGQEALDTLDTFTGEGHGLSMHRKLQQVKTLAYIDLEDWSRAEDNLLSLEDALTASEHFKDWVLVRFRLFQAGRFEVNGHFLRGVREMARRLERTGAAREAVTVSGLLARMALAAGYWVVADIAVETMANQLAMLTKDLGASEEVAELRTQVSAAKQNVPPLDADLTPDEVRDKEFSSGEEALQTCILAQARWPEDEGVVSRLADLYEHFGVEEKAADLLRESRERLPESGAIELAYGRHLLNYQGEERFCEECPLDADDVTPDVRVSRLWNYSELYRWSDPRRALECLDEILTAEPESPNAIYHRARLLETLERYDESIAAWQQMTTRYPDDAHLRWRLLVTATLAGLWPLVREVGESIGFEFDEECPVNDQDMGIIKIEFADEHGDTQRCYARRTGPATATVIDVARQGSPQRYGMRVVFDPAPLNDLTEVDDDGDACDSEGNYHFIYRNRKIVEAPEYHLFTLDGVHPGEEPLEQLRQQLADLDVVFSRRSSDEYILELSGDDSEDEELPGLFAYMLLPMGADPAPLNRCLEAFSAALVHPLVWPELLEVMEDFAGLERQAEISRRYNL